MTNPGEKRHTAGEEALTIAQIGMMKHAWGWSEGKHAGYRTHYCTATDNADMMELVEAGMFVCTHTEGFGEKCAMYHLTDKGISYLKELKR